MIMTDDALSRPVFRVEHPAFPTDFRRPNPPILYSINALWSDLQWTPDLFRRVIAGGLHGGYTHPNLSLTAVYTPLVPPRGLQTLSTAWMERETPHWSPAQSTEWRDSVATLGHPMTYHYYQLIASARRGLAWTDCHRTYGTCLIPLSIRKSPKERW